MKNNEDQWNSMENNETLWKKIMELDETQWKNDET